jgi:prevent-host-death family protein
MEEGATMDEPMEQTITVAELRKKLDHYLAAVRDGGDPVLVKDGETVVGVLVAFQDYEHMADAALREMLRERMKPGPTVSHEEAKTMIREAIRKAARQP